MSTKRPWAKECGQRGDAGPVSAPTCPHCGEVLGWVEDGALKVTIKNRVLAVRLSTGVAETNCSKCRKPVELPLTYQWWRPES